MRERVEDTLSQVTTIFTKKIPRQIYQHKCAERNFTERSLFDAQFSNRILLVVEMVFFFQNFAAATENGDAYEHFF